MTESFIGRVIPGSGLANEPKRIVINTPRYKGSIEIVGENDLITGEYVAVIIADHVFVKGVREVAIGVSEVATAMGIR